jgi:hypothetical protein
VGYVFAGKIRGV